MNPKTLEELFSAVEKKEIVSAKNSVQTFRLFIATNGELCYFRKGSGRRGYTFTHDQFDSLTSFQKAPAPKTEGDKLKKQYSVLAKYKRMAQTASFTNSFIKDCKNIPEFEVWEKSEPRPKSLYDLHITTGNRIDGKVVSIERIAKQYPHYAQLLRKAISEKMANRICSSVPFAGYDMNLSTEVNEKGEFMGYLSLEFKGCGNGYYYLLINDENFIGYDVD